MILKQDNNLLNINGINPNLPIEPQMIASNAAFVAGLAPGIILPNNPPVEQHPYDNPAARQDFEKYIIGTFPPISYLKDHPNTAGGNIFYPDGNNMGAPNIPFYHGNDESLWKKAVFAASGHLAAYNALGNNRNAKQLFIQNWLIENKINIADIIQNATRKAYTYQDKDLKNIIFNTTLIGELIKSDKDLTLLFNTSPVFNTQGFKVNMNGTISRTQDTSFGLTLLALEAIGFKISFDWINPIPMGWVTLNVANAVLLRENLVNKCIIKVKLEATSKSDAKGFKIENSSKEFTCVFGPSPAGNAAIPLPTNLIYQNAVAQFGPMNHPAFCSFMMGHFLNYNAGGEAALIALNQ
jgi:hypothetical protein